MQWRGDSIKYTIKLGFNLIKLTTDNLRLDIQVKSLGSLYAHTLPPSLLYTFPTPSQHHDDSPATPLPPLPCSSHVYSPTSPSSALSTVRYLNKSKTNQCATETRQAVVLLLSESWSGCCYAMYSWVTLMYMFYSFFFSSLHCFSIIPNHC